MSSQDLTKNPAQPFSDPARSYHESLWTFQKILQDLVMIPHDLTNNPAKSCNVAQDLAKYP